MPRRCNLCVLASAVLFCAILPTAFTQQPGPNPEPGLVPDVDAQASGPVHEAFAQPFEQQPEPGPIVPKKPPEPIPELPPEERPEGDDFQWIPGYWAWDAAKQDYLWLSGTYRKTPADRQFVPGYWSETTEGWRWVPGYWSGTNQPEVPYTPQPPATLENGPSVPGPEDTVYVPGYWSYKSNTFAWRPGYWCAAQPGRMWMPPSYRWSPAGYVFVNGYWDYPFADRGLLFAPVYFNRPLWQNAGWCYRPAYTISTSLFLECLFYRPSCGFYFGNYFGNTYAGLGYRPWYANHHSPYNSYYRHHHRGNPGWYNGLQQNYVARANGQLPLPPRTLAQQHLAQKNGLSNHGTFAHVVAPLHKHNAQNLRLTPVPTAQLKTQQAAIQRTRDLAQQRQQFEAKAGPPTGSSARSFQLPGIVHANSGPKTSIAAGPTSPGRPIVSTGPVHANPLQVNPVPKTPKTSEQVFSLPPSREVNQAPIKNQVKPLATPHGTPHVVIPPTNTPRVLASPSGPKASSFQHVAPVPMLQPKANHDAPQIKSVVPRAPQELQAAPRTVAAPLRTQVGPAVRDIPAPGRSAPARAPIAPSRVKR